MADPRTVAVDILDAVLERAVALDIALAEHKGLAALEARDRGQARRIVATALRRLGEIDARIGACLDRPLAPRHGRILNVLRAGVAELVYLDTPPHAAVDAAVRIAGRYRRGALKGLVNAVLRRVARGDGEPAPDTAHDTPNLPRWLFERWREAYGDATAAAIAAAHLAEPPLDITLSRRADPAEWAARLDAEILPGGTLRRTGGGRVSGLPGYEEGMWWIQDAAAALPARMLRDDAGARIADLCAAPGGKTLQLADRGPAVTALDISGDRLGQLRENLARTGLTAELVCADAAQWRPATPFDAVLLDAPCTATGTIRRHPDIPWRRSEDDIRRAAMLQDRLLRAAINMVRPGGAVVYAVCSLEHEEGSGRIDALLASGAPVTLDPLSPADWPELDGTDPPAITSTGTLRTLPCHWAERGGMDGFFAARLIRN